MLLPPACPGYGCPYGDQPDGRAGVARAGHARRRPEAMTGRSVPDACQPPCPDPAGGASIGAGRVGRGAPAPALAGLIQNREWDASVRRRVAGSRPARVRADTLSAMTDLDDALAVIDTWGAEHAAAAVVRSGGVVASRGDPDHVFRWASVTKVVTALTVLVAVDRDLVALDDDAGPPGATVRHLLAHASGLGFEGSMTIARPGTRRIYSNAGFDVLGEVVAARTGEPFEAVMRAAVLDPLGMARTTLHERPSQGLHGPLRGRRGHGRRTPPSDAHPPRHVRDGDIGRFPGPGRPAARCRAVRSARLGSRCRVARRQDVALDGRREQLGDVRALRRVGDLRLGRS